MNASNINLGSIKLIIWDLDDTLWEGTLSEGDISLPSAHIDLIKDITDSGVINSICSKNNEKEVVQQLEGYNIAKYFVFKSINWGNKGARVNQIISDMALRNVNVLFIDDNISNIKEVEFYNPGILATTPDIIPDLISFFRNCNKKDINHKRLKQYKVLEQKREVSASYASNEDFLRDCNITLQINRDCNTHIDRLHELSLRTNQLNFTKKRLSIQDFSEDIRNHECGYITVQDRFGDYGIVGFYAINRNRELEHFFFSCRTIGQGVEQYVYSKLNFPLISIIGEVAIQLDEHTHPNWITETYNIPHTSTKVHDENNSPSYLFKGPCDMSSMIGYLQLGNDIVTEFTFNDDLGRSIENHNHSAHIYGFKNFSVKQFETLKEECFFIDRTNFDSDIFKHKYKVIFLSTLIEGNYGLYRRIETGEVVAYGHYDYPLTDPLFWDRYINKEIPTYNYNITRQDLENFSVKYQYIGRTSASNYIKFLDFLLANTNESTCICLILGSETPYNKEIESTYYDRSSFHKSLNIAIKNYSETHPRIKYIELTKYIKSQTDFTNNINHFKPYIYYAFAKDVLQIIKEHSNDPSAVRQNYKAYIYKRYIQPLRAKTPKFIIDILRPIYKLIFR